MNRFIRILYGVMALILVIALAGCASTQTTTATTAGTTTAATTTAATTTAATTTAPTVQEPVTITLSTWKSMESPIEAMLQSPNLTNITIELQLADPSTMYDKYKVELSAGEGADIIVVGGNGAPFKEFEQFFLPLNDYAIRDFGDNWKDQFEPLAINGCIAGEELKGLPIGLIMAGTTWYTKDIFTQYNLQEPKTYSELKSVAKTLSDNNLLPLVHGAKDTWVDIDVIQTLCNEYNPSAIYDAEEGVIPWTDPDLVKGFTAWRDFFVDGIFQKGATGATEYMDAMDLWMDAKAGMIFLGSWNITPYTYDAWKERFTAYQRGFFTLPDLNGDGKPSPLQMGLDQIVMINKNCENPEAAWKVVKELATGAGASVYYTTFDSMPAFKNVTIDYDSMSPEMKENAQKVISLLPNVVGNRGIKYPEIEKAVQNALIKIATTNITVEDALAEVEAVSQNTKRD